MSKKNNNVEIHLESLNGMAPFIVAVDDDLVITYASPSVLQRFGRAVGLEAAELLAFDDPREKITTDSILAHKGCYRRFALLDGFPATPLAGQWIESREYEAAIDEADKKNRRKKGGAQKGRNLKRGFVLLAAPDVREQRDLELRLFTFKDFPHDGSLVDFLLLKDKFTNRVGAMTRALRALKDSGHRVEISGMRSDRDVVRLQREMAAPRHPDRSGEGDGSADDQQNSHVDVGQGFPIQGTAVYTVDVEGRITGINEAFHKMTGYSEVEVLGRNCSLLHEEPFEFFVPENGDRLEGEQFRLRTKNGERLLVLKGSSKVRDHLGHVTGCVESFVDVTALGAAISTAREEGVSSSGLVINRNLEAEDAMRGIVEMLGLVLHSDLRPEQCEQIGLIRSYSDLLLDRLSDVADAIRIGSGGVVLDASDFSLRTLLSQAVEIPVQQAREKGVLLECRVESAVPDALKGDCGRLRRVVGNIVGNAVRFTERGQISFTIEVESRTDERVLLRFIVSDTGKGISEEQKESIIESFESENSFADPGDRGIGLGLLISSKLIRLMGGDLWFESEAGRGSSFHFNAYFAPGRVDPPEEKAEAKISQSAPQSSSEAQTEQKSPAPDAQKSSAPDAQKSSAQNTPAEGRVQESATEPDERRFDPLAPTPKIEQVETRIVTPPSSEKRDFEPVTPSFRSEDSLQTNSDTQVLTLPAVEVRQEQTAVEPTQPQPAAHSQQAAEPQTALEPQVAVEPHVAAEPQEAAAPQVAVEPQVAEKPQVSEEPQEIAELQAPKEPKATTEPKATVVKQASIEPSQPVTAAVDGEAKTVPPIADHPLPVGRPAEGNVPAEKAESKEPLDAAPGVTPVSAVSDGQTVKEEQDEELESFVARFDPLSPTSKAGRIKLRLANAAAAEEAARRAEEELAKTKAAEEEASRAIAAELARRQAVERAEAAEEAAAEEARKKAAEAAKQQAAEEARKQAIEEAQKKAAEEAIKKATEAAKKRAAEEAAAAAEAAAKEAAARAAEEAAAKAVEEAAAKAAMKKAAEEVAAKAAKEAAAKETAAKDAAAKEAAEKEAKKKAAEQAAFEAARKRAAEERAAKEAAVKEAAAKEATAKEAAAKDAAAKEAVAKAAREAKQKAEDARKQKAATAQKSEKFPSGPAIEEAVKKAAEDALKQAMADDGNKGSGAGPQAGAKKEKMTTKTITLPVTPPEGAPKEATESEKSPAAPAAGNEEFDPDDPLLNLPVLVVDDNRKNRRELKAMLRGWNMKPTVVNGGRAALAALRQSMQAGKPYGLMLLDAEMPEMDGFQIAEKIKESDLEVGEIIMLTSDDQLIDSARLKELGIAACLWMPVKPKVLLAKITQVIEAEFDKTDTPAEEEK